jgi:hypothetical protein
VSEGITMGYLRKTLLAAAAATCVLVSVPATADDYADSISAAPSGEAMAFDLLVGRPLGVVATILGTALFVISLPIDLLVWNVKDPAQRLVVEPARWTFARDLGQMD